MSELHERSKIEVSQRTIEFFEKLLRASTDGIVITDVSHNIIVVNEAFCSFFGRQRREVLETNLFLWLEQIGTDGPKRWVEMENRVYAEGSCHDVEFVLTSPNGAKHLSINASLVERVGNEDAGVIMSIWRDVTEQKRTAELVEQMRLATFVKDVSVALTRNNTLQEILRYCAEAVANHLHAAFARIWTLNERENVLELQASAGMYTRVKGFHSRIPVGKFKIGRIAQERKPHLANFVFDGLHVGNKDQARRKGMAAFAGYPLVVGEHLIGVMAMLVRNQLTEFTLRALASVADIIALGIVHKQNEEELIKSENRFKTIFNSANDGILMTDIETRRLFMGNTKICQMLGYTAEEIKKLTVMDIHPREALFHVIDEFERHADNKNALASNIPMKRKDNSIFYVDINSSLITIAGKTYLMGIFRDITERKQTEEKIRHIAFHDPLTNLPNRLLFNDRLTLAIAHARRTREMLAVMFLDLDRFKIINDTMGHTFGDQLLYCIAEKMKKCVREGDTVARLGGDEFSLLITGITHMKDVHTIARKILNIFKQQWVIGEQELYITASIGVAFYPDNGEDVETLLKNADVAMYDAKEQGRNNYQFYVPAMHAKSFKRMAMETDLRRALEHKEFVVYYQPQMDINTGQIIGTEALVRWQHPDRGLIFPSEFLSYAEETRLVVSLDEWVLQTACIQNKAWQDAGFQPMCVAVNLSAHTFQKQDLVEKIKSILMKTGLNPHFLGLEITESIAMQDIETTIKKLKDLRDLGIQIAIDDFGEGFSSLRYLKLFPINKLKFSPYFVRDIVRNQDDKAIVASVIALARSMKFRVIAEGVETDDQLSLLKQLQCDDVQGYLFCEPLSARVLERKMAQGKIRMALRNKDSQKVLPTPLMAS
ncbi:MAG: EAL domain-containing protein [Candidatus Brocadia sp.]|jgi:diguanylate cyclase (GGDEF)-like protein/PAS domain S-box-containing protein